MLRCFNYLTLGPEPCFYGSLLAECFAEAIVFETELQPVELWINGSHVDTLAPDTDGVVWLAMLPLVGINDRFLYLRFATKQPAKVRFVRHVCLFDLAPAVLSFKDELGQVPLRASDEDQSVNEQDQRKWAVLFRRLIARTQ